MNLLTKMREVKDLTPSERHIVEYIFANLNEIVNIGIVELAELTCTSTATVKRLCKKVGKDSYIDFRLELSYELMRYNQNSILKTAQTPVDRYDSLDDIVAKVANQNAKSILDTSAPTRPKTSRQWSRQCQKQKGSTSTEWVPPT